MKLSRICALVLFPALLLATNSYAVFLQKEGPLFQKAEKEYRALKFASAIKILTRVVEKDPLNVRAQEMLASSYRNIREYDEALHWYGELTNQKNIKPEWALYYAEALANKEKYEQSEQWYRKYLSLKPGDRRATAFTGANMANLNKEAGNWEIEFLNINTEASEYSPMLYKDGLLFISNRNEKSRYMFAWDQTPYTDMFVVENLEDVREHDESAIERRLSGYEDRPNSLMTLIFRHKSDSSSNDLAKPLMSKVRSSYHEGPAVRLPEGSLMFTRNNYYNHKAGTSSGGINKLKIYTALGDDWEKIVEFPYNNDEFSTGHPAISPDGKVLVFASDVPRGYGGTDLYYCVRTSERGNWGRPVNLGPRVNTEGNEQFPYLDKSGKLYFASTGHPGLGGLDLFEVVLKDMKAISKPQNLGAGINSASDDFGLIKVDDTDKGYFSSNRKGNDDIYGFKKLKFAVKVQGLILDSKTNLPVPGSRVLLMNNGRTDTILTNTFGEFTTSLGKSVDYELSGRAMAYLSKMEYISTKDISQDSTIKLVFKLNKVENVQKWVLDNCDSLKRSFNLENVYFDLDNSEIRSDYIPVLERIADKMKKNPQISIITSSHTDSRASENYNRELSLRRGQSVRDYLASRGVNQDRIEVKYYGKSRLINSCVEGRDCSDADQFLNRRTEFEVVINGVNLAQIECKVQ